MSTIDKNNAPFIYAGELIKRLQPFYTDTRAGIDAADINVWFQLDRVVKHPNGQPEINAVVNTVIHGSDKSISHQMAILNKLEQAPITKVYFTDKSGCEFFDPENFIDPVKIIREQYEAKWRAAKGEQGPYYMSSDEYFIRALLMISSVGTLSGLFYSLDIAKQMLGCYVDIPNSRYIRLSYYEDGKLQEINFDVSDFQTKSASSIDSHHRLHRLITSLWIKKGCTLQNVEKTLNDLSVEAHAPEKETLWYKIRRKIPFMHYFYM